MKNKFKIFLITALLLCITPKEGMAQAQTPKYVARIYTERKNLIPPFTSRWFTNRHSQNYYIERLHQNYNVEKQEFYVYDLLEEALADDTVYLDSLGEQNNFVNDLIGLYSLYNNKYNKIEDLFYQNTYDNY